MWLFTNDTKHRQLYTVEKYFSSQVWMQDRYLKITLRLTEKSLRNPELHSYRSPKKLHFTVQNGHGLEAKLEPSNPQWLVAREDERQRWKHDGKLTSLWAHAPRSGCVNSRLRSGSRASRFDDIGNSPVWHMSPEEGEAAVVRAGHAWEERDRRKRKKKNKRERERERERERDKASRRGVTNWEEREPLIGDSLFKKK